MKEWNTISKYNLIGVYTLIKKELWREWSSKHFSLIPEVSMVAIVAIFIKTIPIPDNFTIQGMEFFTFVSYGIITTSLIANSFASPAFGIVHAKMENYVTDFIMSPLTKLLSYLSIIASSSLSALFSSMIIAGTLIIFGFEPPTLIPAITIICLYIFISFSFGTLGLISGIYSKDWDSIGAKNNLVLIPIIYLSGVFYGIETIDPDFQFLLYLNPVYKIIEGVRIIGTTGTIQVSILLAIVVLIGVALTASCLLLRKNYFTINN